MQITLGQNVSNNTTTQTYAVTKFRVQQLDGKRFVELFIDSATDGKVHYVRFDYADVQSRVDSVSGDNPVEFVY